ncbi:MAG: hypothetical protein ACK5KM_03545, partial [Hyphomicrobiaceae bacterium]
EDQPAVAFPAHYGVERFISVEHLELLMTSIHHSHMNAAAPVHKQSNLEIPHPHCWHFCPQRAISQGCAFRAAADNPPANA